MKTYAWRLPLFALLYIVTSYLAAGLASCAEAGMAIRQMTEAGVSAWDWIVFWMHKSADIYRCYWFTSEREDALPLWLSCALLFVLAARKYGHSGQANDGWRLACATLLWSSGGAELFFWLHFMLHRS